MHIPPPVDPFRRHSLTMDNELLPLINKYPQHIVMIFCGHIHGYGRADYGGVPCMVTGGAGAPLHPIHDGIICKFNYALVNIESGTITHQVYFLN